MNTPENDEHWMRQAIQQAQLAIAEDEVPVGAILVMDDAVIGRGRDCKIQQSDPTAHAEILALREAARNFGDWRLEGSTLYVTLEPCPMCAGAILLARVSSLVYGAPNHKFGACGTITNLLASDNAWNHTVTIQPGLLADECSQLMSDYFARKRQKKD